MYQLSPLSEQIARRADSHNRIINTRTYREQMLADYEAKRAAQLAEREKQLEMLSGYTAWINVSKDIEV